MKKQLLLLAVIITIMASGAKAQGINDAFFSKVSYIGAFGTDDWTKGWSNFDPQNTVYPSTTSVLGNGELSYAGGEQITGEKTIEGVVNLKGWVYVKDGGKLIIKKGTIVRGEAGACIVVERGGQIIAEGSSAEPIVFTSNKPVGERFPSDWAGIIICGKAVNNQSADVLIEGGVGAQYGGTNDADNSGILKYVRIEFAGYDIDGKGNEINSLTMGSVGNGTIIEYVQCSFGGDDSFEWFGGTVNCRYIIALATEDDDFDCDFGYRGHVQFALTVRDPKVCDNDGARGFECDNDAKSSAKKPYTSPIFSNITLLGPGKDESVAAKHDYSMMLRRNTRMQIYNVVSTGYVKGGVVIDGDVTQNAVNTDSLKLEYSIFAGYKTKIDTNGKTNPLTNPLNWLLSKKNDTITSRDDLKIQYPVILTAPVFVPEAGSAIFSKGSVFGKPVSTVLITSAENKSEIKTNETLQLSATVTPDDVATKEVIWSIESGSDVAGVSTSGLVTALKSGTVKVKAAAADNSNISNTYTITVQEATAVKNTAGITTEIYPNPFVDQITYKIPVTGSLKIEIVDITGKLVARLYNGAISGGESITFNPDLNKGIYFSHITINGQSSVSKIVKK